MYESTVKQALVRQPLILGLERQGMVLGAIPTLALAALSIYEIYTLLAAVVYASTYWRWMLRGSEHDSQFPTIWLRWLGGKDTYRSYRSYGGSK